jgi:hypothetical protein
MSGIKLQRQEALNWGSCTGSRRSFERHPEEVRYNFTLYQSSNITLENVILKI